MGIMAVCLTFKVISDDALLHKFEYIFLAEELTRVWRNTNSRIDALVGGVIYSPSGRSQAATFTN